MNRNHTDAELAHANRLANRYVVKIALIFAATLLVERKMEQSFAKEVIASINKR